jgi:predicted metal-dependent hydrolase
MIHRWLGIVRRRTRERSPEASPLLPGRVELDAVAGRWDVRCEIVDGPKSRLEEQPGCLRLALSVRDPEHGHDLMRRWLLRQGKRHLMPWLRLEAERVGAAPRAVQIRTQRTRWGSCSARGTISLNAALLFLDPSLVRYLLVHELCHLRQLNHSAASWRQVARFEPDHRELDARLAASRPRIPAWALPR